jgi:hypothetical protein
MISSLTNWIKEKRDERLGKPQHVSAEIDKKLASMSSLVEEQRLATDRAQEILRLFNNQNEIRDRISGEQLRRGA